jgi:large subunit ribosomal protein L5
LSAADEADQAARPQALRHGKEMMARLKQKYQDEVVPALMEEFGYSNVMEVPKLEKIVVNVGLGEAINNAKALDSAIADISTISGQRPVVTRAKKSIAAFKLRAGMPIGAMVTLRGPRMYEFFDRLISVTLPRIRDFRGVSPNAFDGRGNYTLGLQDQIAFPEIDYDRIDKARGLELSLVTSAKTDDEGQRLLALLGMPFARTERLG